MNELEQRLKNLHADLVDKDPDKEHDLREQHKLYESLRDSVDQTEPNKKLISEIELMLDFFSDPWVNGRGLQSKI